VRSVKLDVLRFSDTERGYKLIEVTNEMVD